MADFTLSKPVAASEPVFGLPDQSPLWFSLGVGLLVMQVGAYLVPTVDIKVAALAIITGSIIGSAILALAARLGQVTGRSSGELIQIAFGSRLGQLPVLPNIIQLLGWTAFEIAIMRDGSTAVLTQWTGLDHAAFPYITTAIWGGILLLLMFGSMTSLVRKFLSRIGLPLVVLSLIWLTYHFVSATWPKGFTQFWETKGTGETSFLNALDLVIAMPVSWLPLVADYARYGRSASSTTSGTFIGYVFANIWCYALGVLVIVNQPSDDLVTGLLLAQFGLIALSLIVLDELDNAYGDLHSASVSSERLFGGLRLKQRGLVLVIVAIGVASMLDMHVIAPFLLLLSSVFVPLFGVMLARFKAITAPAQAGTTPASRYGMTCAWIGGIATYHFADFIVPDGRSALPSLAVAFGLASILGKIAPESAK